MTQRLTQRLAIAEVPPFSAPDERKSRELHRSSGRNEGSPGDPESSFSAEQTKAAHVNASRRQHHLLRIIMSIAGIKPAQVSP
jgi:hypothetical protein